MKNRVKPTVKACTECIDTLGLDNPMKYNLIYTPAQSGRCEYCDPNTYRQRPLEEAIVRLYTPRNPQELVQRLALVAIAGLVLYFAIT